MAKHPKSKRTAIKNLAVTNRELSGVAMTKVQGGATNLNSSRTNRSVIICQRCGKVGVDKNPCCPPPSEPNL